MHRLKLLGLTLTAALALTAVASASASAALPEFVPGHLSKFPIPIELKSNGLTPGLLEDSGGFKFGECRGVAAKGEITGAKAVPLTLEVENCAKLSLGSCTSVGSPIGVQVFAGNGTLVYINKATKQVGVALKLNEGHILCGSGYEVATKGTVVIPITPINTETWTLHVVLKESNGKQQFELYENEIGEIVKGTPEVEQTGTGIRKRAGLSVKEGTELGLPMSKPVKVNG